MRENQIYIIFVSIILLLFTNANNTSAAIDDIDKKIQLINDEIEINMDKHDIPGISFVLVDSDGVVYSKGYGYRKFENKTGDIDEDTNFNLGSLSKVFTTVAVLKLQEQGLLTIDHSVVTYLPWFETRDPELSKKITIKNLLTHSSGLPERLNVHDVKSENRDEIIREISNKLKEVKLVSQPGSKFEYTNMNTDLLQLIIEEVSGKTFTQYMQETIFEPLEMTRTGYFTYNDSNLPNTAVGHQYHWGKVKLYKEELVFATSSSAGLSSNASDLGKFMKFLLNEGETPNGRLLKSESINQMFQPNGYGFGFNWYLYPHNIHMDGGLPGFASTLVLSADRSFALALLSNSNQKITYNSGFNLYRIVNGGTPSVLEEKHYPKVKIFEKIVIGISILMFLLILTFLISTIYQLLIARKKISFQKPNIKKSIKISIALAFYIGVMYYIYKIIPFNLGVPTLFEYKKEPNVTSALFMFTIVYSIFTLIICLKQMVVLSIHQKKQIQIS